MSEQISTRELQKQGYDTEGLTGLKSKTIENAHSNLYMPSFLEIFKNNIWLFSDYESDTKRSF